MTKKFVFSLSILVFSILMIQCSQVMDDNPHKIDSIFNEFKKAGSPGCAVAVVHHGKIVHKKGYGLANLEYNIPITTASIFDIASVSKQFAGLAISTLIHEGKLSLDDDVHKYVPEVPDFGHTITIRHLLHHTSGLRDWPSTLHAAGWRWDETFAFDDIIRMLKHQKDLDFVPGDQYSYSNTGYNLLSVIVEKASGIPFKKWTSDLIFRRLGMNSSFFLDDATKIIKGLAYSYSPKEKTYVKDFSALTAAGSSSLFTTVDDLIKWVVHFNQQLKDQNPVYTDMLQDGILNNKDSVHYGYGLGLNRQGSYHVVSHTGGWAGYRTIISNYPEEELSIIILSNRADFNPNAFANRIAGLFISLPNNKQTTDSIQKLAAVALDTSLARKYTGLYKLGDGWYVRLTLENNQMWTQANGESSFLMTPKTKRDFWIDAYNASMHFQVNTNNTVDTLIYKNIRAPKIIPIKMDAGYLNDFTGNYFSDELSTLYTIDNNGQNLVLHHFRLGDIKLEPDPATIDLFNCDLGHINFDRKNKHVSGLRLSGGRIKNIQFRKRNEW